MINQTIITDDFILTPICSNMDNDTTMDKGTGTIIPSKQRYVVPSSGKPVRVKPIHRTQPVSVSVIDEFDYNKLPGTEVDSTPFIQNILAVVLIGIGLIGFTAWTVEMVSPQPPYNPIGVQRGA